MFKSIKKLLMKDSNILGLIKDYFFIAKFQSQGSQHDHGDLRVDVPLLDIDIDEDIALFVD